MSSLELTKNKKDTVKGKNIYDDHVLIIDQNGIYMYTDTTGKVEKIISLIVIKQMKDVSKLKRKVLNILEMAV